MSDLLRDLTGRLFKPREAALYLAVTEHYLSTKRREGGGPPTIMLAHNTIRYRQSDLDEWIDERRQTLSNRQRRMAAL